MYIYPNKRVFTRENLNMNYNDYNRCKRGIEILKTIKREDNIARIDQFKGYNEWQTLSNAYFKYINNDEFEESYIKGLYNSSDSYINNAHIIQDKSPCYNNKNTLYPYGNIIEKKEFSQFFPSNIMMCRWCNNKKTNNPVINDISIGNINYDCCCKKYNKNEICKLCKNARPLFI